MNKSAQKILIIDDDVDICILLDRFLRKNGYEVTAAHKGNSAIELIQKEKFDLIMCDFRLGDLDGVQILTEIKRIHPETAFIMITGYSDIKVAVKVIKLGAYDYVTKPLLPEEILLTIRKALDSKKDRNTESYSINKSTETPHKQKREESTSKYVIGKSKEAKELYKQIDLVAPTNYSVIIFGETGTGKESVARTIHERSDRKDKPFVAVDCGALSKELAGSELFGHEKGAFTGALNTKIGHFELANGGTLFLDEVANLSYEIQTLLLRIVQEQQLKRIGGVKEIPIDVRIIVASNENLYDATNKGRFREDLYHRFNQFGINLPPLRDREDDILTFANYFLQIANQELKKEITGFSQEVIDSFTTYQWPGNLRELNNVIKRAALLTSDNLIEAKNIPQEIINNIKRSFNTNHITTLQTTNKNNTNLKDATQEVEYETIINVLRQVNFNKTKAAKILNIDRKTLYNKMKALNI